MSDDVGASATVVVVLVATMALGVAGISVDLWRALAAERSLVALADGAATAGATALDAEAIYANPTETFLDPDEAQRRACDHLVDHDPTVRCGAGATVTVGPQRVRVTVQTHVPLTLLRLLTGDATGGPLTIRAESTVVAIRGAASP